MQISGPVLARPSEELKITNRALASLTEKQDIHRAKTGSVQKNQTNPSKQRTDKSLEALTRYFSRADIIHKELWWVIAGEKKPSGKSPFGKVERALLTAANRPLSNKSIFRCDRYTVDRKRISVLEFPQTLEIFEKCSEKVMAKKIADIEFQKESEVQVDFYAENLEEVLGIGPTVFAKKINCVLKSNSSGNLSSMHCKGWSQDRAEDITKAQSSRTNKGNENSDQVNSTPSVQMIFLESYDFYQDGPTMIKAQGRVYENLTESRKIDVLIPQHGKITVTETELYAPPKKEEEPVKPIKPNPKMADRVQAPPKESGQEIKNVSTSNEGSELEPVQQNPRAMKSQSESVNPADEGWPADEYPGYKSPENPQQSPSSDSNQSTLEAGDGNGAETAPQIPSEEVLPESEVYQKQGEPRGR